MDISTLSMPLRSIGNPEFTHFVDWIGDHSSQHWQLLAKTTNIDYAAPFLFP
jgi:hypothetical protein